MPADDVSAKSLIMQLFEEVFRYVKATDRALLAMTQDDSVAADVDLAIPTLRALMTQVEARERFSQKLAQLTDTAVYEGLIDVTQLNSD